MTNLTMKIMFMSRFLVPPRLPDRGGDPSLVCLGLCAYN